MLKVVKSNKGVDPFGFKSKNSIQNNRSEPKNITVFSYKISRHCNFSFATFKLQTY